MNVNVINTDNFAELRRKGGYFVDKTPFLVQFLRDPTDSGKSRPGSDANMILRPKGFGKSIIMSMLAEFLDITKDSRELFAGLKVAEYKNMCARWMNQVPVIFLSFKGIDEPSYELTVKEIGRRVTDYCSQHKYLLASEQLSKYDKREFQLYLDGDADKNVLKHSLYYLTSFLSRHYGKEAVVLVDGYDVPLANAARRGFDDDMYYFIRGLFSSALKTNSDLSFGVLAGYLRFTERSIFSGFNNLDYYDFDSSWFNDCFGFTQEEVDQLLASAGLEKEHDPIREWYGGYHIGSSQMLYCPASVMQYVHDSKDLPAREPKSYWVGTEGRELTRGFDRVPGVVQDDMALLLSGKPVRTLIDMALDYSRAYEDCENFLTLLYLTGFLTEVTRDNEHHGGYFMRQRLFVVPNLDVRAAIENEVRRWFKDLVPNNKLEELYTMFWDGDAKGLEEMLEQGLLHCPNLRDYRYIAPFYCIMLLETFGFGHQVAFNPEGADGVYTLKVTDERNGWIALVAVKSAKSEEELEADADKALQKGADSGGASSGDSAHTRIWGMSFYRKHCRMKSRCQ